MAISLGILTQHFQVQTHFELAKRCLPSEKVIPPRNSCSCRPWRLGCRIWLNMPSSEALFVGSPTGTGGWKSESCDVIVCHWMHWQTFLNIENLCSCGIFHTQFALQNLTWTSSYEMCVQSIPRLWTPLASQTKRTTNQAQVSTNPKIPRVPKVPRPSCTRAVSVLASSQLERHCGMAHASWFSWLKKWEDNSLNMGGNWMFHNLLINYIVFMIVDQLFDDPFIVDSSIIYS